jgi:alkaline phosphatase D
MADVRLHRLMGKKTKCDDPVAMPGKLSRRQFLRMAAWASATLPAGLTASGCATRQVSLPDRNTGLCFACMAGDVSPTSAVVWLRAEPESVVTLHYGKQASLRQFEETVQVTVDSASDHTAKIVLQGLEPETTYYYRAVVHGKKPGAIGRFVTAPSPEDLTPVKFCFSGDTRESYQPFTIMDSIRERQPNFFLHLGDTIYADIGGRAIRLPDFWRKYQRNREDVPSQKLFASTSTYVIWDDHEVTNDYDAGEPLMPVGRKAFLDYWPIQRNPQDPNRLYRAFRWGKALELFIVDSRQHRDRARRTMLGEQQKRWLFEGLASSTAIFKFIATSVPFYGHGRDKWDGFPEERDELLRWIADRKIRGVVFLAADVHYAAVSRIPGPLKLKEVIAGPIGSPMNVITDGYAPRFEFFSNTNFNYAMITVDPKGTKPHAVVEHLDETGTTLYKTRIDAV